MLEDRREKAAKVGRSGYPRGLLKKKKSAPEG
jgi:hypothetical protein